MSEKSTESTDKDLRGESDVIRLQAENQRLAERIAGLKEENSSLRKLSDGLRDRVKYLLSLLYGPRSEKLSAEELKELVSSYGGDPTDSKPLLPRGTDEEAGSSSTDEAAVGEASADAASSDETKRGKRRRYKDGHPGRSKLSECLERIVREHTVPSKERACGHCGLEMTPVDHVEHERVEFVPAKLVVHVDRREVLACRHAGCQGEAMTAERPAPEAERCRLGHSVAAQLIEAKCADSLPIERQRDQFARLGFDVAVNTLYSQWNRALDSLRLVGDATLGDILAEWYVRIDDTGVDVLDRNRKGGKRRGHLWCFVGGVSGLVGYHFTETWRADEIEPLLKLVTGYAQVDDWGGYSANVEDGEGGTRRLIPNERRLGCGMHTRRRFHEDRKLGGKRSGPALLFWKQLYEIEDCAKKDCLTPEARYELRQEKSVPIMEAFDEWVDAELKTARPKSRFGRALRYAKNQREYLHRCLSNGHFELDNGEPERRIRKPAVGRRNWLFTGSNNAGRRLATAYTLVQSCRALGIPTRDYLIDVLRKIEDGWPTSRLSELMPHRWAEARAMG